MKEIKNIIFDMGRVLLKFDPFVSLNTYCENKEDMDLIYKEFNCFGYLKSLMKPRI